MVTLLRTELKSVTEVRSTTTLPLRPVQLTVPNNAELTVLSLTVEIELSTPVRNVMMEINNMEMVAHLSVLPNAVTEKLMEENNAILDQLLTTKSLPTDADLVVLTSTVVMLSKIPMNNAITELPTLILLDLPAEPTAETLSVVMVLLITVNNAIL